jgi:hypothetical protein
VSSETTYFVEIERTGDSVLPDPSIVLSDLCCNFLMGYADPVVGIEATKPFVWAVFEAHDPNVRQPPAGDAV